MSMDRLRSLYYGLYGENGITNFFYDQQLTFKKWYLETRVSSQEQGLPFQETHLQGRTKFLQNI